MKNYGIINKTRSYISYKYTIHARMSHHSYSFLMLQELLFQSAFKLHIQFPNITSRHPQKTEDSTLPQKTLVHTCFCVRMEYEYYFPKYIYLSMSITGQVSALHYQISLWFTFAHLPLQKLREHIYFSKSCRGRTTANMYSKYSY